MTKMSKSELELMKLIWQNETPVTCSWLLSHLPDGLEWKTTTVLTFLSRMTEKGMVHVEKQGKSNVYTAAISEERYRVEETTSFLEDVHGGSVKSLIASLCDTDGLTGEDLDELRIWLSGR